MKHLKDTSAAALSPQRKIHFDYPWLSAAVPLVVLMIVLPLANPRFLTVSNLTSVLLQAAVYVIMALGILLDSLLRKRWTRSRT